jgi:hypothetical protein
MRKALGFLALAITSCLTFMPLPAQAQYQQSTIIFPEVEGWEKGEITTYPTAELGYSVPYQSQIGGTVTVYVYNGGFSSIGDGISDTTVVNEIRKAENDIHSYEQAGYYQDVNLIKSETVNLGYAQTNPALHSLFTFSVRGTPVESSIFMFGYRNNFIKVRSTHPQASQADAEVSRLLAEIVNSLPR